MLKTAAVVFFLMSGAPQADYFPPPEELGGWRSLLPAEARDPGEAEKAKIRETAGVNWDRLREAWEYNASAEGASQLLVIRKGWIVGEWSRGCDRKKAFNIYSSSKAYTSLAFGILLDDVEKGKVAKKLSLDTKVVTEEWLPEAFPLPDPRKAEITLRHLLNMAGGLGAENVPGDSPFEWALGKVEGSPMAKLKGDPGKVFNYSNAGVAHLVLVFNRAAGRDLLPFMKERVFDVIGERPESWTQIGGAGKIGPYSQGYSGVHASAREHARFCHLALKKGTWAGKQVVPASYYDFAWKGQEIKPDYGAQWWVQPRHPDAPKDLVQTAGARNNHGYVAPSLDLVVVRTGDGNKYPARFDQELVKRVLAAVEK